MNEGTNNPQHMEKQLIRPVFTIRLLNSTGLPTLLTIGVGQTQIKVQIMHMFLFL